MTAIATAAREAAVNFEAKKTGFGQAQDGWSLTLRIQDNDVPAHVRDAKKGTRYMVALVEIGDDEQPVNREQPRPVAATSAGADKPKSPAQVAGYLCSLVSFSVFLQERYDEDWYACRQLFDGWVNPGKVSAEVVRLRCGVKSRSEITADNPGWKQIVSDFRAWEKEAEVVPA